MATDKFLLLYIPLIAGSLLFGPGLLSCRAESIACKTTRVSRPVFHCQLKALPGQSEPNREPVASAAKTPGIFRSFLVWRQHYAHLALCTMTLCHGSCLDYGDGCLARVQNPILPQLMDTRPTACSQAIPLCSDESKPLCPDESKPLCPVESKPLRLAPAVAPLGAQGCCP